MVPIKLPDNKQFAFTIFDDTDWGYVHNLKPIYDLLEDLGFRTTKTVWVYGGGEPKAQSLQDNEYLSWIHSLQDAGFEIGWHMAKGNTSTRDITESGFNHFYEALGHYPVSGANHSHSSENIYWGKYRVTGINAFIYNILTKFRHNNTFQGHNEYSPLFWGDLCQKYITYYRNFVFNEINTLSKCPWMPYYDPGRPYVNRWFASSEGAKINSFNHMLKEENQDRLEAENGICIMYTHLGAGFTENGQLNPRFVELMTRLSKKNGWFVPVSTLLDHMVEVKGVHTLTTHQRRILEWRWLRDKILLGST